MSNTTVAPAWQRPFAANTPAPRGAGSPTDPSLAELAHEFEALMMLQMLRQMRQSALLGDDDGGLGAATMTDTIDLALGQTLSRSGGFGLASWLKDALARRHEPALSAHGADLIAANAAPVATAAENSLTPAVLSAVQPEVSRGIPAVPLPLSAPLTSAYGWRQDPFGGGVRFHAGVDFGAAYGRVVPAAGEGRVAFAGEQGGYGLTVVVDHGNGVTTRYAHLSSIDVAAGNSLETGAIIGRVGQSGRATGPHLHFEVREHGRAVDPVIAAARFGDWLKVAGQNADLPHSRSLAGPAGGTEDAR